MKIEFYKKQYNRRRDWEVIEVAPNQEILKGAEVTLSKALALSQLELPVGEWIGAELVKSGKLMHPGIIRLLQLNQQDEIKHDKALNKLRDVFPVRKVDDEKVSEMVNIASALASHYSPIVVAGVLESSLFFVILPMYRFLGGGGFRTVANDISNDENIHVAVNLQMAKDLGYNRGNSLDRYRLAVIDWLTEDLPSTHTNKYLSRDFWIKTSNNLYYSGKAPQLKSTQRAVMPSFFEKDNRNLPVYG